MFFNKIFLVLMFFSAPSWGAGLIENSTCLKEIKRYYPLLKQGKLHWEQQERFFRCIEDSLELIVVHKLFTHSPDRDYFTREEIYKMFHVHFKMDKNLSDNLVKNLFLIKHLVVGGEQNQLRDEELKKIHELVEVYKDFYYIIHKRINTIHKIFDPKKRQEVSDKEFDFTISKLEEGFKFLRISYKKRGVSYRVSDLDHLLDYVQNYQKDQPSWSKYTHFLKMWYQGILDPANQEIKQDSWNYFFGSFSQMVALYLQYKRYIVGNSVFEARSYPHLLRSFRYFVSALSFAEVSETKKGFPVRTIDEMLSTMISLSKGPAEAFSFLPMLAGPNNPIPFFTRNLTCFVLVDPKSNNCSYKKVKNHLEYKFPDGTYKIYNNKIKWSPTQGEVFETTPFQFQILENWLQGYELAYRDLSEGQVQKVSKKYQFHHWVDGSFSETQEEDVRVVFYSFYASQVYKVPYRFLNYRMISGLLLSPYWDSKGNISSKNWKRIVDEILPSLIVFKNAGYDPDFKKGFLGLFGYADRFLNSSNNDGFLNQEEILDLIIHIMSASQNAEYAYPRLLEACSDSMTSECVSSEIFNPDIIQSFPRLKNYLFNDVSNKYSSATKDFLDYQQAQSKTTKVGSLNLLEVFLILQMLEVQFHKVDQDQNARLNYKEISKMVQNFADQLVTSIPYIKDRSQAKSFVAYSFKTGKIPFLKEEESTFHSLHFFNFHIGDEKGEFEATKGKIYSVVLQFYKLYKDHL
ncbi:MAG: hypothetical protein ACR2M7_05685 [Bdellovibrionales bacterium]